MYVRWYCRPACLEVPTHSLSPPFTSAHCKMALTMGKKNPPHGKPLFTSGVPDSHLHRFHSDPQDFLGAYGVFHGDDRQPSGEPLPTGSLRRSPNSPPLNATTGSGVYHTWGGGPPASYTIRPTMSLQSLLKDRETTRTNDGSLLGMTGRAQSTGRPLAATATTSTYQYPTGSFVSTSGLPPTQYKSWTSEYVDEYRGPKVRKENLEELTIVHGTGDALRTSRYQFQGYPYSASNPAFKTGIATSLTNRNQVMPNYESRVKAF